MVGKLAEAPFIGVDDLARTRADDTLEPSDRLFLYGFAQVRTKNKNSLVTPQRAHLLSDSSPRKRGQGSGCNPTNAILSEQVKRHTAQAGLPYGRLGGCQFIATFPGWG